MNDDFDGVEVTDLNGTSIGKVVRTYIDDANTPRYVEVKFGTLLPKHRLVPVDGGDFADDGHLHVTYDKDVIEGSPDAPDADTLESADLERVDSYYAGIGSEAGGTVEPAIGASQADADTGRNARPDGPRNQFEVVDESAGGIHVGDQVPAGMEAPIVDRGDTLEVPVLEEVLVKKTVVKEILRVRKSDVVEQETVEGDVRKESVELDDPSGSVTGTGVGPPSH